MGKVLQVVRNQELRRWCGRHADKQMACPTAARSPRRARHRHRRDPGAWLQARVPCLQGPIPTAPYLLRLRHMIAPTKLK